MLRNRAGSEVTPAVIRRLALILSDEPYEIIVADETIKMASTELLQVARMEGLDVRVVRAKAALAESLASAAAPYVAIADCDDRHPLEMLPEMLHEAEQLSVHMVIATRRDQAPRIVQSACGRAVTDIADPLSPYFVAHRSLFDGFGPKPGATVLALDLLLAHPQASVSQIALRRRDAGAEQPGLRRKAAEAIHVARLLRGGTRLRAHGVHARASWAAFKIKRKAKAHPAVFAALLAVMLAAIALRFWALPTLHWYGHDEARASFAAQRMLVEHKPVLTGQPTSRGVYLGPGYYYLVAPFYALFGMSPFAGAFVSALAGVLAVFFAYRIGREVFGEGSGLAAAAILATAPIAVYFSRFGWNPNTLPFFAALFLYALIKARTTHRWLGVAAFCAGLAPQLHATGLIFPAALFLWILTRRPKLRKRSWAGFAFALSLPLLPMMAAELRSGFEGTRAWIKLLLGRGAAGADLGGSVVGAFKDVFVQTIGTPRFAVAALLVTLSMAGVIVWERKHWNDPARSHAFATVAMFTILGAVAAVVWRGQMFAYWLLPWIPGAIVLFAGGLVALLRGIVAGRAAVVAPVVAVTLIAGFNVAAVANPTRLPDQFEPASPVAFHNVAAAADWIAARVDGPFELQVITPYSWDTAHNLTFAYEYLLLRKGLKARPGGGGQIFVIAMEDVAFPHLHHVRISVRNSMSKDLRIVDVSEFGGSSVFELRPVSTAAR